MILHQQLDPISKGVAVKQQSLDVVLITTLQQKAKTTLGVLATLTNLAVVLMEYQSPEGLDKRDVPVKIQSLVVAQIEKSQQKESKGKDADALQVNLGVVQMVLKIRKEKISKNATPYFQYQLQMFVDYPKIAVMAETLQRNGFLGDGRNFTTKWFFDMEYGGCSKFFDGGKGGNRNNFQDQITCEKVCVNPTGRAACVLPEVKGPCEGYYPRYSYNSETKSCNQFIYGGCLGNNNKFQSLEECEGTCSEDPEGVRELSVDKCKQIIEAGPCQGNFTRWGYNTETEECEIFTYGGCNGNDNAYMTKDECDNSCKPQGFNRQMCLLPRDPGPCKDNLPKWYFDNFEKRCVPFYYGGCDGNDNKFDDLESCQKSCPKEFLQADVCKLPQVPGTCGDYLERFYFDIDEGVCKPFYYGGCDGNKNNFKSMENCQSRCSVDYSIPIAQEFKLEFCLLSKDVGVVDEQNPKEQNRWYYDSSDGVCKQMQFKGRRGNGNRFLTRQDCEASCRESQNICTLPKVRGPCNSQIDSFWFDEDKNSCFKFTWGGCQGNGNRFESMEFCEAKCKDTGSGAPSKEKANVDICNLPIDSGPCTDRIPNWYFNTKNGKCSAFIYSGCEGNANRFITQEQCDRNCGIFKGKNVCGSQMDIGPCVGRFKKWYFDLHTRTCHEFTFGGCEGNGNRFSSLGECETVCLVQDELPIQGNNTEVSRSEICMLQLDEGSCDDQLKRWYFNEERNICAPFLYTGCAGNRNRFKSYDICMGFCGPKNPPSKDNNLYPSQPQTSPYPAREEYPQPPYPTREEYPQPPYPTREEYPQPPYPTRNEFTQPPPYPTIDESIPTVESPRVNQVPEYDPSRCAEFDRRCREAYCQFGLLRYRDDRSGCDICYCNEPCQGYSCPENTQCSEELYRVRENSDETAFRPLCRPLVKEGVCPKVSMNVYSSCEQDCRGDSSCSGSQKCCFNGCGESCMDAVVDPGMNIPESNEYYPPPNPADIEEPRIPTDAARIHVPMPTIIANEGDIAALTVHVDGNPHPDVYWRVGRRDIDTRLGKYKVLRDGTLQIIGVDPSDEGVYTCLADNGRGHPAEATVTLAVDSPNDLEAGIVPTETDITLSLGSPATLECLAYGFPKPSVTWWKDREMLPMSSEQHTQNPDFSLHIRSLNLRDLGQYTCQVFNGIGNGASHSLIVRALGPVYGTNREDEPYLIYLVDGAPVSPTRDSRTQEPPYSPSQPQQPDWTRTQATTTTTPTTSTTTNQSPTRGSGETSRIDVRIEPVSPEHQIGQYIQIECTVNSYTRPHVYWYKNGQLITPENNIQISGVNNTLIIYRAEATDRGTYTCQADNGYASQTDSVTLSIVERNSDPGFLVGPECTDNPYFVNCKLIVRANYCGNKYYAKFCCKSCRLARQI
uniref:Papilinlike [Apis florea] n=1 Tax=Lepeophtheirus salmonis TaxID=72036 RepID=A0A0K2VB06_LEPSM